MLQIRLNLWGVSSQWSNGRYCSFRVTQSPQIKKADVVPGLEGEFVNIRESSAQMSISRMASLIEYVTAYGVANGVKFNDRWGFK